MYGPSAAGVYAGRVDFRDVPHTASASIDDGLKVSAVGTSAKGVYSYWGGLINIADNAEITAEGTSAYGILSAYTSSDVTAGNHLRVTVTGTGASGLAASGSEGYEGSRLTTGDDTVVTVTGDENAKGIYAAMSELTTGTDTRLFLTGARGSGVYANIDGIAELGENAVILVSGDGSCGVHARDGGAVTISDGSSVHTTGDDGRGVYTQNGVAAITGSSVHTSGANTYALYSTGVSGEIRMAGGSIDAAGSDSWYLAVDDGGLIDLNGLNAGDGANLNLLKTASSGTFTATGGVLTGNVLHDGAADGTLGITLNDARLTGSVNRAPGAADAHIDLMLNGSVWNVTGNSDTGGVLNAANESVVDFTPSALGTTVRMGGLSGGAHFLLKTDIVGQTGDKLIVEGASDGSHTLSVTNRGSEETTGTETLTVVETSDGIADFTLVNEVSVGPWIYGLQRAQANQNNWELYRTGGSSPTASAAVNTFTGAYLLSYAETQTLMQRLGDLRDTPFLSGAWFRVYGGKFESNGSSFVRGFDMDYGGVQVGYDRKLENSWKGDTYIGGYFGYGKGDLDYNTKHGSTGGSGEVDGKTVGVYAAYVQDNGFYADAVVKYMWMKNKFGALDTDGEHVTGEDLSTGGVGISLELGKRFRFKQNDKGGNWYVEPQVQYSYTHQDGGCFRASNGLNIDVDSLTSSIGRVGVLIGYETPKTNFYAKASFVKEFDGDVNIVANNTYIPESFGDSWWVYGLGFTTKLNERNNIYMSVERSDGGKFDEPWRLLAGWRISF